MASIEDQVLVELHRAAFLAQRAGICLVSRDAPRADQRTGSRSKTRQAIERLKRAGRIIPVRRDVLVLPDATGRLNISLLELVAATSPEPYLITGGAALEAHALTDQHFVEAATLVPSPTSALDWRGEKSRPLLTKQERIWGGEPAEPRGERRARPVIARPARALLDALGHPRYGVSFGQAAEALRTSLQDVNFASELLGAAARHGSLSAARRVGLMVELLAGPETAAPFRSLVGRRTSPVLLRPGGPQEGEIDSRWRVRRNADLELVSA